MKKIVCLLLTILICVLCFSSCSGNNSASDLEYVKKNGKMVIGVTKYAPMNYIDDTDNWTGFDTEYAQVVCAKFGINAEFVEIVWDNKYAELDSRGIDCIWNGMTISDEVIKNADVSTPYVQNAQVVVMKKTEVGKYATVESMKGLKFVAESDSAGEGAIKDNGLDENYIGVTAQTDALLEVMSGSADACVIDITMAESMTGKGTSYESLAKGISLAEEEYGIAFRKGSDLTNEVNKITSELVKDGTLAALANKYNLKLIAK